MHIRRSEVRSPKPLDAASTRRRASRDQRGVTVLEAAFVTPVFLLLIMALAEAGLYMKDYLAVSNTVSAGSRAASASGNDPYADLHIVSNVARESSGLSRNAIEYIVVYRADTFGDIPDEVGDDGISPGCLAGHAVVDVCNVYTPAHFDLAEIQLTEMARVREAEDAGLPVTKDESKYFFGCKPSSPDRFWCPVDRNVGHSSNGGEGPDYVGVYMKVEHGWLTGIFGADREISDLSVIRMEPREL